MAIELLLVRSAESEAVALHDSPRLTERGKEQAASLGRLFLARNYRPDALHTSQTFRAQQSTRGILQAMDSRHRPIRYPELDAIDVQGRVVPDRTLADKAAKMVGYVRRMSISPEQGRRILVVTHDIAIRSLMARIELAGFGPAPESDQVAQVMSQEPDTPPGSHSLLIVEGTPDDGLAGHFAYAGEPVVV